LDSEIGHQPLSFDDTLLWAKNRVKNLKKIVEADYYVGIEGGVTLINNRVFSFGITVIENKDWKQYFGISAMIELPEVMKIELYEKGKELWDVVDDLTWTKNNKSKNGAIGLLTNDALTRTAELSEATLLALMPFINQYYK